MSYGRDKNTICWVMESDLLYWHNGFSCHEHLLCMGSQCQSGLVPEKQTVQVYSNNGFHLLNKIFPCYGRNELSGHLCLAAKTPPVIRDMLVNYREMTVLPKK